MRLRAVAAHDLPELWPQLRERVASCCARSGGKYEPLDVLMHCLSRRMDLWLAIENRDGESCEPAAPTHAGAPAGDLAWRPADRECARIAALAITEIVVYPRITVCKLLACTGDDAQRWIDLLAPLETWAKAQGCAVMEPICRPGWERQLKPAGYRKTHVVLEKSL
jgi:hypothetical protein